MRFIGMYIVYLHWFLYLVISFALGWHLGSNANIYVQLILFSIYSIVVHRINFDKALDRDLVYLGFASTVSGAIMANLWMLLVYSAVYNFSKGFVGHFG